MNAISLVMETGFAVTAFLALFLNLFLPEEIENDAVDVDGKEGETVPQQTHAPAKALDSSRASDAESMDRIEQHTAKETRP